jgi:hypothetical protein
MSCTSINSSSVCSIGSRAWPQCLTIDPKVFYKPYESRGQAWPITFRRLMWGVLMFQLFMVGVFTLSASYVLSGLMAPLIAFSLFWGWYIDQLFEPLSSNVSLSSVFEVQRGEETADVAKMRSGHPVTWSQRCVSLFLVLHVSLTFLQQFEPPPVCTK